jgi:hypothetical protein
MELPLKPPLAPRQAAEGRSPPESSPKRSDGDGHPEEDARARQHQEVINHANRMLSGSAYRRGLRSGLDLLGKLRSGRCKARSPEANLDLEQIATHASRSVLITLAFSAAALGIFVLQRLLMLASGAAVMGDGVYVWMGASLPSVILTLIGSGLIAYELIYLRWANARRFLRRDYMPGEHKHVLRPERMKEHSLAGWLKNQILDADAVQNVVTFGGYTPFVGAGRRISGWTMAVERKPDPAALDEDEEERHHIDIPVADFYRAVDEAVEKAQLPRLQVSSLLFVKGEELEADGEVLTQLGKRPASRLPDGRLLGLGQGDLTSGMRFYRSYRYIDTARDMMLSYYLRFYNVGAVTFIEGTAYTLTSVDQERYGLAPLLDDTLLTRELKTAGAMLVLAPFGLYALVALFHLGLFLSKLLAWRQQDARHQRAIQAREKYNYGVTTTFRESVAAPFYQDYYGVQDLTMYWRSIEEAVLNGVVELLESKGVDVSQFKEQATTVINSGIMVSGGQFTATQVSAGTGSTSIMQSDAAETSKTGMRARVAQLRTPRGAGRSPGAHV